MGSSSPNTTLSSLLLSSSSIRFLICLTHESGILVHWVYDWLISFGVMSLRFINVGKHVRMVLWSCTVSRCVGVYHVHLPISRHLGWPTFGLLDSCYEHLCPFSLLSFSSVMMGVGELPSTPLLSPFIPYFHLWHQMFWLANHLLMYLFWPLTFFSWKNICSAPPSISSQLFADRLTSPAEGEGILHGWVVGCLTSSWTLLPYILLVLFHPATL